MATSDEGRPTLSRLLERAGSLPEPTWSGPGDLSRAGIEAMIAQRGDVRDLHSAGSLRLTGAGVRGHAADLESVGSVAAAWQRAVTAVGAALEGIKSAKGRVPHTLAVRTRLDLHAAPAPGSLVLNLTPTVAGQEEASPGGQTAIDPARPLADRAVERLVGVLQLAASHDLATNDLLAQELRELGPRVASSVRRFAASTSAGHFDVDLTWSEPAHPTLRTSVSVGAAASLVDFVAGRDLDAVPDTLVGTTRTISEVAKWQIETAEGFVYLDASQLGPDELRGTRLGDHLEFEVLTRVTERPDGTSSSSTQAIRIIGRVDD